MPCNLTLHESITAALCSGEEHKLRSFSLRNFLHYLFDLNIITALIRLSHYYTHIKQGIKFHIYKGKLVPVLNQVLRSEDVLEEQRYSPTRS
jgi:hypothetical protein